MTTVYLGNPEPAFEAAHGIVDEETGLVPLEDRNIPGVDQVTRVGPFPDDDSWTVVEMFGAVVNKNGAWDRLTLGDNVVPEWFATDDEAMAVLLSSHWKDLPRKDFSEAKALDDDEEADQ